LRCDGVGFIRKHGVKLSNLGLMNLNPLLPIFGSESLEFDTDGGDFVSEGGEVKMLGFFAMASHTRWKKSYLLRKIRLLDE
jgi:hypothetical protein